MFSKLRHFFAFFKKNKRKHKRFEAVSGAFLKLGSLDRYPLESISEGGFSIQTSNLNLDQLETLINEGKGVIECEGAAFNTQYTLLYKNGDSVGFTFENANKEAIESFFLRTLQPKRIN